MVVKELDDVRAYGLPTLFSLQRHRRTAICLHPDFVFCLLPRFSGVQYNAMHKRTYHVYAGMRIRFNDKSNVSAGSRFLFSFRIWISCDCDEGHITQTRNMATQSFD